MKWKYTLETDLRSAIDTCDPIAVFESLDECYWELCGRSLIDDEEYISWTKDFELYIQPDWFEGDEEEAEFTADSELAVFYDLCDALGVWIPT